MKQIVIVAIFISSLWSVSVTDMLEREVKVQANQKILAIGPGALRLISYMQADDLLVGIERLELDFDTKSPYRHILNKDFIASLPIIGEGGPGKLPDIEAIIKTDADIIFTSFLPLDFVQNLQNRTQIPVVALSYGSGYGGESNAQKLTAIKNSLHLLGQILDKQERATALVDFMDGLELLLNHSIESDAKLYIGGIGFRGARGFTSTESDYPSFELLGVQNSINLGKRGHSQISYEKILINDPDTIFLDSLGRGIINEELQTHPQIFQNLSAFENKKIYWLYPYNFYNTNIENIYINAFIIASKLGANLDIESIQNQIFKKFLGLKPSVKLPAFNE